MDNPLAVDLLRSGRVGGRDQHQDLDHVRQTIFFYKSGRHLLGLGLRLGIDLGFRVKVNGD